MGEYSKLDSVKTIGGRGKINAIWWNIKINLQKLVDICGCELPTNLKNFMQTDLTKVKISLKGLRGYFFETPGICYERIVIIFRMICLSVFLFGMHLLGNYWTDLAEILHMQCASLPERCVSHFGCDRSKSSARGAENVPWERYCVYFAILHDLCQDILQRQIAREWYKIVLCLQW